MKKILSILLLFGLLAGIPVLASEATEPSDAASDPEEVTAEDLDASEEDINNATEEEEVPIEETGMLIEIGNTTAEETTIIIRVEDEDGNIEDITVEIDQEEVDLDDGDGGDADLSDWIAGDQITFKATENSNSGSIRATMMRNHSFRRYHEGKNGWITDIRNASSTSEIDITWNSTIYTLNMEEARIVAGLKNPASVSDLVVGDRIRARVMDDGDGNDLTWDTKILVVLRRGNTLFMRVTRWVVHAEIIELDEDPVVPTTITVEILPSKFFEAGDVNNLIGAPGETLEVYVDEDTKLRRRYLGKSLISEFSEGDQVQIIGRLNEETGKLDAQFVRNASIQKLGVARRIGTVVSVDVENRQIQVTEKKARQEWRIDVAEDARIFKQREEIGLSDIEVGDRIRVFGTANRRLRIVAAQKISVLPALPASSDGSTE